jgi:hypothetical protein
MILAKQIFQFSLCFKIQANFSIEWLDLIVLLEADFGFVIERVHASSGFETNLTFAFAVFLDLRKDSHLKEDRFLRQRKNLPSILRC